MIASDRPLGRLIGGALLFPITAVAVSWPIASAWSAHGPAGAFASAATIGVAILAPYLLATGWRDIHAEGSA